MPNELVFTKQIIIICSLYPTVPVELDPNLPEELVGKFHNNSCELCDVKVS